MQTQGVSLDRFLQVAGGILQVFLALPKNPNPERTGCYISLFSKPDARFLTVTQLGQFSDKDLANRCFSYCQEKASRLFLNKGHISSWQSRDFDAKKYGGAVTAPFDSRGLSIGRDLIVSISGLPEPGDEAMGLALNVNYHWMTISDLDKFIAVSQNQLADPLIRACGNDFYQ